MSPTAPKLPAPISIPPLNAYTHPTPPLTPLTPHPLAATPAPPSHLLSHPYTARLGAGAWSTVYALTPQLAVKTPSHPTALPILHAEAAVLSHLTSTLPDPACIARIHYYDPRTAHLYIDHLTAGTLESHARGAATTPQHPRGAPVCGFAQWLFLAERLVAAVAAVHAAGVLHGDIKWGNVLLREYAPAVGGEGVWDRYCAETGETLLEPVLCDFSSAQRAGAGEDAEEVNAVTTGFAAPEVLAGFLKGAGAPALAGGADVYSVGMTLLAAALGSEVYEGVRHVGIYAREGDPVGWVRGGERAARVARGGVVEGVLEGCFGRGAAGRVGLGVLAERVQAWRERWWVEGRKGGRWGW